MLALPLRLPTAPYGGHMGHFLLSMLMLSGSAPFGNTRLVLGCVPCSERHRKG